MIYQPPEIDLDRSLDQITNAPSREEPVGFILRLAKALHTYGVPAYELEQTINACADTLGYGVQCLSTPTAITLTLLPKGSKPETFVIRVPPGVVNMHKLQQISDIAEQVMKGDIAPPTGARLLKEVAKQPPLYASWVIVLAFTLVSGSISRIFLGGLGEIVTASSIGFAIGLLSILSRYSPFLKYLFPSIASFIGTLVAFTLNHYWSYNTSIYVSLVAGLIILLPGLTLTIAMAELATENLVSGTARLFSAATIFVQLGFGSAMGSQIGQMLYGNIEAVNLTPVSDWSVWIAVLLGSVALVPLFAAKVKDSIWIVFAGLIAFATVRYTSPYIGASLSAFVGAIVIGLSAKIISSLSRIPGALIVMPGFIMLVPGSVGYKSIMALVQKDIIHGMETGLDVLLIGISLVGGLLLSSLVRLPRREEGDDDL
ncbi:MAG: hypothetical protein COW84_08250 [Gammaproteobacteria bacterium CG22_combo_CG10-13_8_21_14_all_40_8]|nr:MAG: hypothetical protein COW84_08250 [Gammaproteobacteria bacterium CG22_combo_CG10-13_8_21_14_all_40_8]